MEMREFVVDDPRSLADAADGSSIVGLLFGGLVWFDSRCDFF